MGSLKELLSLAQSQVGYQEKKSAASLDDFHGNAGYNNYTKYARDVNNWGLAGCQGQPWCATYQFWLEAKIFGVDTALSHFCMKRSNYSAYNCFSIYDAFAAAGKASKTPKAGCLVVFRHSHIGRVTAIRNGRIYTNEGNTSALYGDSNGGTVKNKDYAAGDSNIFGYCLIDYQDAGNTVTDNNGKDTVDPTNPETSGSNGGNTAAAVVTARVESYQRWLNTWYEELIKKCIGNRLEEDGIYGAKTRNASLAVWKDVMNRLYGCSLTPADTSFGEKCREAAGKVLLRKGSDGTLPAIAEGILAAKGYYKGNIDAAFGSSVEAAVRQFQKKKGLECDGIIGPDTWGALFG
ncbi:MAG: peptidoglycan-binding protein [Eubacteriales bacterium]|nr:peptidoglycan-binding protein [Eubacteriales bacterium]